MAPRFGTDGIRGVAGSELTPELALALGRAAARIVPGAPFLLGRDTRRSGTMIQSALAAGLTAEGVDVVDAGVIPTPGLAWLAADRGVPAAMVSASHNPFGDNGIKLLAAGGTKLASELEISIQDELDRLLGQRLLRRRVKPGGPQAISGQGPRPHRSRARLAQGGPGRARGLCRAPRPSRRGREPLSPQGGDRLRKRGRRARSPRPCWPASRSATWSFRPSRTE